MSGELRFGFENNHETGRLQVSGPTELLDEAGAFLHKRERGRRIKHRRIFSKHYSQDKQQATWLLNARNIGNMKPYSQAVALERAAQFYGELSWMTEREAVRPDPRFLLELFQQARSGEFMIQARTHRPDVDSKQVKQRVVGHMAHMAHALRFNEKPTMAQVYRAQLAEAVYYDVGGVTMHLGNRGNLHNNALAWDSDEPRFDLISDDIEPGKQPLIYLAGAVAIAHFEAS